MKKYLIFICAILPQILCAQIQVDIAEMTISQLKDDYNVYRITNGVDTTSMTVASFGSFRYPFLELKVKLRNSSDTIMKLQSEKLELGITYYFEGDLYDVGLDSKFYTGNEDIHPPKSVMLKPDEECYLVSYGDIVESSWMSIVFMRENDNTSNVMKILPTIKVHVLNRETGQKFIHGNIFEVKIMKRPFGSTLPFEWLPEGYYSIVE